MASNTGKKVGIALLFAVVLFGLLLIGRALGVL